MKKQKKMNIKNRKGKNGQIKGGMVLLIVAIAIAAYMFRWNKRSYL